MKLMLKLFSKGLYSVQMIHSIQSHGFNRGLLNAPIPNIFAIFLSKKGEQAQLSFLSDSSSLSHTASWLPSFSFHFPSEAESHPSNGSHAAYIDERSHYVHPATALAIFLPSNLPPNKTEIHHPRVVLPAVPTCRAQSCLRARTC